MATSTQIIRKDDLASVTRSDFFKDHNEVTPKKSPHTSTQHVAEASRHRSILSQKAENSSGQSQTVVVRDDENTNNSNTQSDCLNTPIGFYKPSPMPGQQHSAIMAIENNSSTLSPKSARAPNNDGQLGPITAHDDQTMSSVMGLVSQLDQSAFNGSQINAAATTQGDNGGIIVSNKDEQPTMR